MSLEDVFDGAHPMDPEHSSLVTSSGLYSGLPEYKKDAARILSLYNELMVTLNLEFKRWARDYKVEQNTEDTTRYFGLYDHIPEDAGLNIRRYREGIRLDSIIMMNYALYKNLLKKDPDLIEYTMFHEMLHGEYELGEQQTYTLLVKFFKHMAFISWGKKKRKYEKLAQHASAKLKAYEKSPYETVSAALATINSELRRRDISKSYRRQLLSYKAYLKAEKSKLEKKKKDSKKTKKKTKKQTKSSSKNNKKNRKKSSKKTKSKKSSSKGKNSGGKKK